MAVILIAVVIAVILVMHSNDEKSSINSIFLRETNIWKIWIMTKRRMLT